MLLTLAFWAFIIKVAFEHKCCTKAKNKNRIQKIYNSTLHMKNRLYSQLPVLFLVFKKATPPTTLHDSKTTILFSKKCKS